jgi:hypothetical protein
MPKKPPRETKSSPNNKVTEKNAGSASKVLREGRSGKDAKTAAGSALTQRPGKGGKKK